MPSTSAMPMPDHEDIRWCTAEEFDAFVEVVGRALDVALAYGRNPSAIGTEMYDLMAALKAVHVAEERAKERRRAERAVEIAALERRFGPDLWG